MTDRQELFGESPAGDFVVSLGEGRKVYWQADGHAWTLHGHRPDGVAVVDLHLDEQSLVRLTVAELLALRQATDLLLVNQAVPMPEPEGQGRGPKPKKSKSQPPSAGKPWTPEQDDALRGRFAGGEKTSALAAHFGRTSGAIRARLVKLGLLESP
jgi:hypothetical protein